jgi:hypothetical protein
MPWKRGAVGNQHPGKIHANPFRDDFRVPLLDHRVDVWDDHPEPDISRHAAPPCPVPLVHPRRLQYCRALSRKPAAMLGCWAREENQNEDH